MLPAGMSIAGGVAEVVGVRVALVQAGKLAKATNPTTSPLNL
jgi:hypothetical protein